MFPRRRVLRVALSVVLDRQLFVLHKSLQVRPNISLVVGIAHF
jgi:hypothetical protein